MLNINIKKLLPEAVIPTYAKQGDAGMDITAISKEFDKNGNVSYGTGLAFEIPLGYVGLLFPRSSNSKKDLTLVNSVGVLDSGYRGEVFFKFKPTDYFAEERADVYGNPPIYEIGERIGQIIILPYPQVTFNEVSELSETERGTGGFGHTGT